MRKVGVADKAFRFVMSVLSSLISSNGGFESASSLLHPSVPYRQTPDYVNWDIGFLLNSEEELNVGVPHRPATSASTYPRPQWWEG